MTRRKVLITGAAGFVGKHLITLLEPDYVVIPYTQQMQDYTSLFLELEQTKPEYIVHLAAKTTAWFSDVTGLYESNVMGTVNLYYAVQNVIKLHSTFCPKILYIGSSEAYGKTNQNPITESALLNPVNQYGASKASADRLSYAYAQSDKLLNIVIVRPFTHTGPFQKKGFFATDMASQIVMQESKEKPSIKVGNLEAIRDYLDVRDVVRAYKTIMESETTSGDIFNVAAGVGYKMSDLLEMFVKYSRVTQIDIEEDPLRMRPSDMPVMVGNADKVRALGWEPKIPLERTLEDVLLYWRGLL
jgi:GDP-4-dehydro-6-deoxy-D-mannose reductase